MYLHLGNGEKLYGLYKSLKIYHSIETESPDEEPDEVVLTREVIEKYNLGCYAAEEADDLDPKFIPIPPIPTNKNPYMATLFFINTLTSISQSLLHSPNKTEYLIAELKKLNKMLPAGVYVPFNIFKARNCAVLHIPVSEARVFTTKERAPYKICIEIFRPYKEIKHSNQKKAKEKLRDKRALSMPISTSNRESTSSFDRSSIKSSDSDFMTDALYDSTSTSNRKRIQTFAIGTDLHYSQIIKNGETGSLSAVYSEIDQIGNNVSVFKESFKQQALRLKQQSPYGKLRTWSLLHVIIKSGDDLRQEQLAMQLISFFKQTFDSKKLDVWLYPYDILATGLDCGILECVPDAVSIDGLKKALPGDQKTLVDFFLLQFGDPKSKRFKAAKKCFMKSLVGYSLVCYILQIKDRHNGNILIDRNGHLIHIDFGFMISNSPGGNINFEKAPFKLTNEFEALLGGRRSKLFQEFRQLCVKGFVALNEKAEQIILMVEMMRTGSASSLGCFIGGEQATTALRERLMPKRKMSEGDCKEYINELIDISLDNWSTKCYDRFQYCCQNIFY
jgi:phosphatidylinositol 4-kinase B